MLVQDIFLVKKVFQFLKYKHNHNFDNKLSGIASWFGDCRHTAGHHRVNAGPGNKRPRVTFAIPLPCFVPECNGSLCCGNRTQVVCIRIGFFRSQGENWNTFASDLDLFR